MTLRFLSLLVFLGILVPVGVVRKALRGSPFGRKAYTNPSGWDRTPAQPTADQRLAGAPHVERHL